MGHPKPSARRRIGGALLATILGLALVVSPPSARTALAAENLRTEADATYTLDPDAGRVHVEIDVRATDLKPNTPSYIYYYSSIGVALQPEATSIRVSGGATSITTRKRDGYIEGVVHLRSNLHYKDSTTFTIRYELAGGRPRSDSPIRVGAAFSTFGVWAWGDAGRSTVEVHTPAGFESRFDGDPMRTTTSATTGQILSASPTDPSTFYAIITSENNDAYRETRISFDGGVEIVVQSWPEDARWKDAVSGTLRVAMPELRGLIGLDWPVEHDLDVRERYTPDLEGYAGLFLTDEQRIDVSEDLDPVVIVHEASHAWFNDALFLERWIYEGLAEEYAWRALVAAGGADGGAAERPDLADPGFDDLATWTKPRVIRDQETDDRERYGYEAAFWVIHQITEAAGEDGMREAFARAEANLTAYPGRSAPETVYAGDSWRRLLDLTEPMGQPESAAVDEAFRDFVLASGEEDLLDTRNAARDDYRDLIERGDGWTPPWYVRRLLGEWLFDDATTRMAEATGVLELRDEIATAAGALDLEPDDALRTAYEGATERLDGATKIAAGELGALAAIADARTKVDAMPDFVAQIGLLGETQRVAYEAARTAFEAGRLAEALASATAAAAIITAAPAIGQQRLIVAIAAAAAVLLLLLLVVMLLRRRGSRRRALALAAAAPTDAGSPDAAPTDAASAEAYGTLAADPDAAPAQSSASPPDDEGGPARSDLPADL